MLFILIWSSIRDVPYWKKKNSRGPLKNGDIKRIKKDISKYIKEGEKNFQKGEYLNARKMYINAFRLEKILPSIFSISSNLIKEKIENIEFKINNKGLDQISLRVEKGDNLKNEERYEEALIEYEKAIRIIDKMKIYEGTSKTKLFNDIHLRQISLRTEKGDRLKNEEKYEEALIEYEKVIRIIDKMKIYDVNLRPQLYNDIHLKQIEALIEEGDKLKSEKILDKAISSFKKALDLTQKMSSSKEKQNIIKKIEDNLDIYSNIIKEKIEVGILLMEQNYFVEATETFQITKDLVKKKYGLLENSISNRVKEVNEIRDINNLISQVELEKTKETEKSISETNLKAEIKAKLKILPEIERLGAVQERIMPKIPEEKPEDLRILDNTPEDLEVIKEKEKLTVRDLEEIQIEEEVLQKEKAIEKQPKEQPDESIPPKPQIIKCSFCGIEINEEMTFCPQCGMIFKKKKSSKL